MMDERVPLVEARPYRRANASFRSKWNVFLMNHASSKFKRNKLSGPTGKDRQNYDSHSGSSKDNLGLNDSDSLRHRIGSASSIDTSI